MVGCEMMRVVVGHGGPLFLGRIVRPNVTLKRQQCQMLSNAERTADSSEMSRISPDSRSETMDHGQRHGKRIKAYIRTFTWSCSYFVHVLFMVWFMFVLWRPHCPWQLGLLSYLSKFLSKSTTGLRSFWGCHAVMSFLGTAPF